MSEGLTKRQGRAVLVLSDCTLFYFGGPVGVWIDNKQIFTEAGEPTKCTDDEFGTWLVGSPLDIREDEKCKT